MCGRYTLTLSPETLQEAFPTVAFHFEHTPRFNIAPSQMIPVIRAAAGKDLQADLFRWGLIPAWSKDEKIGYRLINARAETLAEKPSFRSAFKSRRCLIPADGYFEWTIVEGTKTKIPIYFFKKSREAFAFAGLWETWRSPTGDEIHSATIITTEPNDLAGRFHNRMPAILPKEDYSAWLAPAVKSPDALLALLKPYPTPDMDCFPVSTLVNKPENDRAEIVIPL